MGLRADTDAPRRDCRKFEPGLLVFVGAQKIPIRRAITRTMVELSLQISYQMKIKSAFYFFVFTL